MSDRVGSGHWLRTGIEWIVDRAVLLYQLLRELLWYLTFPLHWPFRSLINSNPSWRPYLVQRLQDPDSVKHVERLVDLEYTRLLARTPIRTKRDPSLDELVLKISGRDLEPVPSLEALVALALQSPELVRETELRQITAQSLHDRLIREGGEVVQGVLQRIAALSKLRNHVHAAFTPAYRAAYDAITTEFVIPRHYAALRRVRTPALIISAVILFTSIAMVCLKLLGVVDSVSFNLCLLGIITAYVIVYTGTILDGYARIRISGQYTRFLDELANRVDTASSEGQELLRLYINERKRLIRYSINEALVPWLLVRARRARRRRLQPPANLRRPTEQPVGDAHFAVRPEDPSAKRAPVNSLPITEHQQPRTFVFLCHGVEDKPAVRILYNELKRRGVRPWLDEVDLIPGQNWELEIEKAIRQAVVVVVCLSSKTASKTGFVQKEIRLALDTADRQPPGTIFVIPALLERCGVPDRLSHLHWLDLTEEDGVDKLCRAIHTRSSESASQ